MNVRSRYIISIHFHYYLINFIGYNNEVDSTQSTSTQSTSTPTPSPSSTSTTSTSTTSASQENEISEDIRLYFASLIEKSIPGNTV